jgi:pimeloyl-ACP methyl ester carboxylesterase
LCFGFLGLAANGLAYRHARAMTHFAPSGCLRESLEHISFAGKLKALFLGVQIPRPENSKNPSDVGLVFETRMVPTNPGRLEAWVIRGNGAAQWVILFHGYAASKDSLLDIAERFHREGFGVVMVDFHGSGGSTGTTTTVGYAEARDVADVVQWVRVELGEPAPILYGFSMGAAAILRAVSQYSLQSRALILQASFDRMLTTVEHRFEMLNAPSFPAAELLLFWGGRINHFDAFSHNPKEYAATIDTPTLVLHGAKDQRVTNREAEAVFYALRGEKSLRTFATGVHDPIAEVTEEQWWDAVRPFLRRLGCLTEP